MTTGGWRVSPMTRAALVLGVGIGGFFDGIVFHQILQWHHMLSSTTPADTIGGLQVNTVADGLFHGAVWVLTVLGIVLLLRAERQHAAVRARRVAGGIIGGWGSFNLVEGIVDHYVLGIHHVRPGPDQALWDLALLAWGAAFVFLGWWLLRGPDDASDRGFPSRWRRLKT